MKKLINLGFLHWNVLFSWRQMTSGVTVTCSPCYSVSRSTENQVHTKGHSGWAWVESLTTEKMLHVSSEEMKIPAWKRQRSWRQRHHKEPSPGFASKGWIKNMEILGASWGVGYWKNKEFFICQKSILTKLSFLQTETSQKNSGCHFLPFAESSSRIRGSQPSLGTKDKEGHSWVCKPLL